MVQTSFDFDKPQFPANPFRSGTQCFQLYEWLAAHGRITRKEIHQVLKQDTARIRIDVKPFLRRHGFDIECVPIGAGNTEYKVMRAS